MQPFSISYFNESSMKHRKLGISIKNNTSDENKMAKVYFELL